jgi:drug/metabolite transporter (DMT)-like permease
MDAMREKRNGEVLVFAHCIVWAFFPIVAKLTYDSIPALAAYAWGTFFAAIFFGGVLLVRGRLGELRNPLLWRYGAGSALAIGVLFYGLYYVGLNFTTAGNASIIVLFEVFTSFVFFNIFRREAISREHILGGILMVLGASIVLAPNFSHLNPGDFLILAATFATPLGNLFQQKGRRIASGESVMFLRYAMTAPIAFALAAGSGALSAATYTGTALIYLALNGMFILGIAKLFWIEAIHRISVTKGVALESISPFFTLVFAWFILKDAPTVWQLASLVPLVLGVFLLTDLFTFSVRKNPKLV